MTFWWFDEELEYADFEYNQTRQNERCVELAIAWHWLCNEAGGKGVEVGCVTPHYWPNLHHTVVDLNELHPRAHNIDLFDLEPSWDWVLAISTIEHVRWDGLRDPEGSLNAIRHLRSVCAGPMLVTVPLGWNHALDGQIRRGNLGVDRDCVFLRAGGNTWVQGDRTASYTPYGRDTPWANAVWIGEWLP